jgi:hypothetical protein
MMMTSCKPFAFNFGFSILDFGLRAEWFAAAACNEHVVIATRRCAPFSYSSQSASAKEVNPWRGTEKATMRQNSRSVAELIRCPVRLYWHVGCLESGNAVNNSVN